MLTTRQAQSVQSILDIVREHLDMQFAFVGEFTDSHRVLRYVSASADSEVGLEAGSADPLEETYCHRIATGRMSGVIRDATVDPDARELAVTREFGVRAHLGTPIVFKDGHVYGTLCSFSRQADPTLGERDLKFLRLVADLIAERLYDEHVAAAAMRERRVAIEQAVSSGDPVLVFQPIVALDESRRVIGYEALSRFTVPPPRTPDRWFDEARGVGLDAELELRAITAALERLPGAAGCYVAVNVSPAVLVDPRIRAQLATADPRRIVLEITEHDLPVDAEALRATIASLRATGMRIAIDDVGAGYSGLSRLLAIAPDIIKLDMHIITGIARDLARQAMVTAAVSFSAAVGATLIAEGIEVAEDLEMLRGLGVAYGQGFLLGRPSPLQLPCEDE